MSLLKKTLQLFAFLFLAWSLSCQSAMASINTEQLQGVLNGLVAPQLMNESYKAQQADRSQAEEIIDPQSGSLILRQTDLSLPGKDGLDLNIARVYESSESELGNKKVSVTSSSSTTISTSSLFMVYILGYHHDTGNFFSFDAGPFTTRLDAELASEFHMNYSGYPIEYYDYWIIENATIYYHTDYTVTTMMEAVPNTYSRSRYDLGHGWSLAFPSLQIESESGQNYYYLHDGSGASYRIKFTDATDGIIEKYPRTDAQFKKDAGTYSNGQVNSAFVFISPDQTRTYFGSDGRLLGITDLLGNEIKFTHTDRTLNGFTNPYISQIVDSIGRIVTFTYENTITDPNVELENIQISVTHPSEPADEITLTYTKEKQLVETKLNGILQSSRYEPYLSSVTDPGGLVTYYYYDIQLMDFDFTDKSLMNNPAGNALDLLRAVQYPHTVTYYNYEPAIRNMGPEGAYEAFRVTERWDGEIRYDYDQPNPHVYLTGPLNKVTYAYFGDITGYPTYNTVESMSETYSYGSASTRVLDELVTTSTYNGKQQPVTQEVAASNGEKTMTTNLTFDANFAERPTKQEIKEVSSLGQDLYKLYVGYEYYDWGGLKSQTLPLTATQYDQARADYTTSYEYDAVFHKLSKKEAKQAAGVTLTDSTWYDSLGRPSYTINANSERTDFVYANNSQTGRTVETTQSLEGGKTARAIVTYGTASNQAFPTSVTTYYTDSNDQVVSATSHASYDLLYGLVTERIDEEGNATQYAYDDYGRITETTLPAYSNGLNETYQMVEHYQYKDMFVVVPEFDTENAYLLNTRITSYQTIVEEGTSTIRYDNIITQYVDGYGNILLQKRLDAINDQNIVEMQYHFDALKRPVYRVDAEQNAVTAVYDPWGRMIETTDPLGNLYRNEYDRATRTSTSYLVGQADVAAFRTSPQPSHQHNVLQQEVNQWGQLVQNRAYPLWPSTAQPLEESYGYDWGGNLTTYTNPRGHTTSYQYDLLSRLKRVTSANQEKTDYTYNRLGNLNGVTQTSADGTVTVTLNEKAYDERGLLTEKTQGSPLDYTYDYNGNGLLVESTDGNQTLFEQSYDSLNRMVTTSGGNSLFESYYGDRPFGPDLIAEWEGSSLLRMTAQTFDAYGNVSARQIVNDSQATITQFEYDPLGRTRAIEHPNAYHTLYTYNKTQVQRVQTNGQSLSATSDSDYAQYEYYPNGMLKKITYPKLDDTNGSYLTSEFEYDGLNRLLSVINKKASQVLSFYSYTYDENGNMLSQTNAEGTTDYTYDVLDRLETIAYPHGESIEYAYDLRGNRMTIATSVPPLHDGEVNYTYNVWDQLTSVDNDGTVTTFEYEPQGMRIKKTNQTETIRYTYDNSGRVIAEADASFTVQTNYVWGPDRLLQKRDTVTEDRYYYLYNGHGDVVQIVDQEGEVVNEYAYDEWGNITAQEEIILNPFKYAGEIYDDEIGLYYLRARYYDPTVGRFINKDSFEGQIDNPLTLNLYTYAQNNPLIYTDPTGHKVWLIHGTNLSGSETPEDTWTPEFIKYIGDLFGESVVSPRWTGGNNEEARAIAANDIFADIISWHEKNLDEPIRLVGHSHGGNVAIMVTNKLSDAGINVTSLITVATPVRGYLLDDETKVDQHLQIYNNYDLIQNYGGPVERAGIAPNRKFGSATNIEVKLPFYRRFVWYGVDNHSYMHSNIKVWEKYIAPKLK